MTGATIGARRGPAGLLAQGRVVGRGLLSLDYLPPVLAFIGASAILFVAARAQYTSFLSAISWFRWDSFNYSSIAQGGYHLYRCTAAEYTGPLPPWCGNSSWFPGYPAILAVLYDLGLPQVGMAVAVSWFFDLAVLILVWNAFLRRAPAPQAYMALIFVACCPGGIYMRAAYPMSMTVFFTLLWLLGLRERRWFWAGLAGGCAAFSYPAALVLIPLGFGWVLIDHPRPWWKRFTVAAGSGALTGLGTLAAIGVIGLDDKRIGAFFTAQSHFVHGFHEPFVELWPRMYGALSSYTGIVTAEGADADLVALVVLLLLVGLIFLTARRRATRWEWFLFIATVVLWLFPATQSDVSYYRDDTLVIPAALLIVRMRADVSVLIAGASVAVFPLLALGYFSGYLV